MTSTQAPRPWLSGLALAALVFVAGEAHEIAHTGLGYLLCGSWGPRDANTWRLACVLGQPASLAVSWAGPLLTYSLIWLGYWLLGAQQPVPRRSLGLALVVANLPLARLLGIALGGNDEVFSLKQVLPYPLAWLLGSLLAAGLLGPPLVRAYRALRSPAWFAGALVLPVVLSFVVVHKVLNLLLQHHVLAGRGLLGEPLLLTCWLAFSSILLLLTYRQLGWLLQLRQALGRSLA